MRTGPKRQAEEEVKDKPTRQCLLLCVCPTSRAPPGTWPRLSRIPDCVRGGVQVSCPTERTEVTSFGSPVNDEVLSSRSPCGSYGVDLQPVSTVTKLCFSSVSLQY